MAWSYYLWVGNTFYSMKVVSATYFCLFLIMWHNLKLPINKHEYINDVFNINCSFQCNKKRIVDYPNMWGYVKDIYQAEGIADTVDFEHIQNGYYVSSCWFLAITATGWSVFLSLLVFYLVVKRKV